MYHLKYLKTRDKFNVLIWNGWICPKEQHTCHMFGFWLEKTTKTKYRLQSESIANSRGCNRKKKGTNTNLLKGYGMSVK